MKAPLGRRLTIAAIALGLAAGGSLVSATAAQAATAPAGTTRTVIWSVPAGFADRFAQPQILAQAAVGCGDFQVDVYRYANARDIAFVDALVTTGILHDASEDGPVFVSNTDVTSTATCAPAPVSSPKIVPTMPSTACVPTGTPADARTASFTLDNTASTEAVTYTVDGTPYAVAAGATQVVSGLPVASTGTTFAITAGAESWSFTAKAVSSCAPTSPTTTTTVTTRPSTPTAGHAAASPRASTIAPSGAAAPAAVTTAPVTTAAAATAAGTTAAADTLAYTGTRDVVAGLSIGVGIIALGIGLVLLARRRRAVWIHGGASDGDAPGRTREKGASPAGSRGRSLALVRARLTGPRPLAQRMDRWLTTDTASSWSPRSWRRSWRSSTAPSSPSPSRRSPESSPAG